MSKMLVKCETKSSRVKGLAFHPSLQWILAALHNGTIQLWDYRIGSLIDKFEEHEGPVRGIDFHSSQQLFVSGGDDYKVKLWSLSTRKCIFTFVGHLDYLRTAFFHHIYPWILSASDDQTVRIWNWQSRSCIAVLTGHNHYVMSALFHPYEDLVVSASLDQTIRVWDTSGLREKTGGAAGSSFGRGGSLGGSGNNRRPHADMFTANDAVCKFVLEGHERGVNWAAFHPSMPLIASAADDRTIKLWRYNDSKAWEVDTLRGHFNNVSCLVFHPQRELLISNSEDRTIRVWDVSKRVGVHTFRRESDRFWIIAAHRSSSALAVGHDSGMVVFKLHTERPPCALHSPFQLYYIRDRFVYFRDLLLTLQAAHKQHQSAVGGAASAPSVNMATAEVSLCEVRRLANAMSPGPKHILVNSLNSTDLNALVVYADGEGGYSYDLLVGPLPQAGLPYPGGLDTHSIRLFEISTRRAYPEIQSGVGGGVRSVVPSPDGDYVMVVSKHALMLVRIVHWGPSATGGGAGNADSGAGTGGNMEVVCAIHENIRIKGGAWDEDNGKSEFSDGSGVALRRVCSWHRQRLRLLFVSDAPGAFVYSTLSHVKYLLLNGDRGIIHCLNEPVYIFKVQRGMYYYLDRRVGVHVEPLNCQEYLFKLALHRKQFSQVALFVRNGQLCGNTLIAYLKNKGYPEVALEFLTDKKARFHLALELGSLDDALVAAQEINDKNAWQLLAKAALQRGHPVLVESAYQKLKEFERLSFLYFVTGHIGKLRKMLRIAELRKDPMSRFHNALLLGDAEERVQILAEVGQLALAALTAKTYGLTTLYDQLQENVKDMQIEPFLPAVPQLLMPPVPIIRCTEPESSVWPPAVSEETSAFENAMKATSGMKPEVAGSQLYKEMVEGASGSASSVGDPLGTAGGHGGTWVDGAGGSEDLDDGLGADAAGEDWSDGIELPPEDAGANGPGGSDNDGVRPNATLGGAEGAGVAGNNVAKRDPPQALWLRVQPMVADFVAAGEFPMALETLQRRIALRNASPLLPIFSRVYQAVWAALPGLPFAPSLSVPLTEGSGGGAKPHRLVLANTLMEDLREAHKLVTGE
ncbi:coatomer subunit alpha, partial [Cystoisospora suis]